jgi:uncharacterized protein (TIGR02453 family)
MPRPAFPGFTDEALTFLRSLERNNRREWFQPRKELYDEKVKGPMLELVAALNGDLERFAPLHVTEPGRAIFRIYRDTRFSKDKKPYKTNIAAYFPRRGVDRHTAGGYYASVSHKEAAVGGGMYMPSPETLATVRNRIADRHEEFRKILRGTALKKLMGELHGEQLSRAPKGFAPDHPAADLLRYKQFFFYVELPADLALSRSLHTGIRKRFEALRPVVDFLNAPLAEAKKKPSSRILF